ncbi:hypothetical protein Ddye_000573 [Dipteronia dyeriana]|uniref:Cytokinin riboside 5'-monophosphate phosphoribohydrolase n=1 Tax=Dipteronia dyeriana TaxID=168575 RepID=A0AAD9XLZ0_9ROSI|nr:hypothetical protein Ddye_000573 [Dipteronia dyeriana]
MLRLPIWLGMLGPAKLGMPLPVEFIDAATHLGKVFAERKIHLVYGGGNLGLMGSVS